MSSETTIDKIERNYRRQVFPKWIAHRAFTEEDETIPVTRTEFEFSPAAGKFLEVDSHELRGKIVGTRLYVEINPESHYSLPRYDRDGNPKHSTQKHQKSDLRYGYQAKYWKFEW